MNKRKFILISICLILLTILIVNLIQKKDKEYENQDIINSTNGQLVQGYKLLEYYDIDEENNVIRLSLNSDNQDLNIDTANKIKSLLGDDIELVSIELSSNAPKVYHLKGFEENKDENAQEQKYIELALQETIHEDFQNAPKEKISFVSLSKESSVKALELMLSMEDKINIMLNNLLKEDEAKEILKFLKEEIHQVELENKTSSNVIISINQDINLTYIYGYSENDNIYYNRLTLNSYSPMAGILENIG